MITRIAILAAAAIAVAAPAAADDRSDCTRPESRELAIPACTKMIGKAGLAAQDRAMAYFYRGRGYQAMGRDAEAIADFDASLALVPDNPVVLNSRGLSNHNIGDYPTAIRDYDRAIAADPKRPFAYNNRGNTRYKMQDFAAALADYDRAIGLDPEYANAYNGRANALCALHRGGESDESRLRAIELGAMRVTAIQIWLARLGFLQTEATGILDPDTRTALEEWSLSGCPGG